MTEKNFFNNNLKILIQKIIECIRKGKIEFDGKNFFDLNNFLLDKVTILNNNNLKINLNFLTNINIELVIINIKYTNIIDNNNNITKLQNLGNFSTNISDNQFKKLFHSIFTYQSQILSFSLTNFENINKNIFNFLITLINFLDSLKILYLKSN